MSASAQQYAFRKHPLSPSGHNGHGFLLIVRTWGAPGGTGRFIDGWDEKLSPMKCASTMKSGLMPGSYHRTHVARKIRSF